MPLPSTGAISLSQVDTELGRASNAQVSLGETAVRNLAGIASGAISLNDLHGKSAVTITFSPVAGTYSGSGTNTVSYAITASQAVTWTWSKTGTGGTADIASGTSATSITLTNTAPAGVMRECTFTVQANGQSWTITLTADNTGGGA